MDKTFTRTDAKDRQLISAWLPFAEHDPIWGEQGLWVWFNVPDHWLVRMSDHFQLKPFLQPDDQTWYRQDAYDLWYELTVQGPDGSQASKDEFRAFFAQLVDQDPAFLEWVCERMANMVIEFREKGEPK